MSDGRATIWKDSDGRWRLDYTDAAGRRKRIRLPIGTTKAQANALLLQRVGKVTDARILGLPSEDGLKPMMFSEFLETEYLPHCEATHTSDTYRTDKSLATIVKPFFGGMNLRAISKGDIQRFIDQQAKVMVSEEAKIRPATINRRFRFVSGALSEALSRGYIEKNPAIGVPQLPEHNFQLRWLTADEEINILKNCSEHLRPIVIAALHTGARKGELLRLRWEDIDPEQRLLRISQSKNHKVRYIPINAKLEGMLEALSRVLGSPFVFTSPMTGEKGEHRHFVNIDAAFRGACRRGNVQGASFHVLRHTFASRLVQRGVPLNTVRELLGHGSMAVTMRYAHLASANLHEAVAVLAQSEKSEIPGTPLAQAAGAQRRAL